VTDINMPRMTGKELCLEIEKRLPQREFKINVLSSMTDREHRDWSYRMRNTVFMEKPVSMRLLVSMLTRDFENDRAKGSSSDV
jgi:response regulator RpfG family c-di-GMP phosphodiesterase